MKPENIPKTMHAVLLTGHGGLEKLEYKTDVKVPVPKDDEVLIKASAGGGGKGMKIVHKESEFDDLFSTDKSEAQK